MQALGRGHPVTQASRRALLQEPLVGIVVRAPITGIILTVELTGSFSLFLPMLAATFAAIAIATLLKEPPIYESLSETR